MSTQITSLDVGMDADLLSELAPQDSGTRTPEDWFFEAVAVRRSAAGVYVNPRSALSHPSVWQAVNILSGDIGQIPIYKMVRRTVDGREEVERDTRHQVDRALTKWPNAYQTPSQWKETVMRDAVLWGNHISLISRDSMGQLTLTPLPPQGLSYTQPRIGEFYIRSTHNSRTVDIPYESCFHVRGLSSEGSDGVDGLYEASGFWGLPVATILADAIGTGLAMQRHGGALFKNAGRPSGVLHSPNAFNSEAARNLRREWDEIHSGADNAGKIAVLWEGLQYSPIAMTNDEAQFLDLRKLDREIVASIFSIPPYMLGAMENSAVRANLEEQKRDYLQRSLTRWTNKIAEEVCRKLFTFGEQRLERHYVEWDFGIFLKSDILTRYQAYSTAITSQFMSPNEARSKEGMNPYEGGDEFRNPAINPVDAAAESDGEDDDEEDDSEDMQEAAMDMLRERVRAMLIAEKGRAHQAATSREKFVRWRQTFYDPANAWSNLDTFLETALRVVAAAGLAWDKTPLMHYWEHQRNSWDSILDVAGEDVTAAIRDRAAQIPDAADQLTDRILGVSHG